MPRQRMLPIITRWLVLLVTRLLLPWLRWLLARAVLRAKLCQRLLRPPEEAATHHPMVVIRDDSWQSGTSVVCTDTWPGVHLALAPLP
jgi:hypothetical protein